MDIKKLGQLESLVKPEQMGRSNPVAGNGPSFQDTFAQVQGRLQPQGGGQAFNPAVLGGIDGIKFSNHAVERMVSRGITFQPDEIQKLNDAVSRAEAKGAKNTLVLTDESALIVSVKNKTVVTVMDKNALKENVFTNIDSTVVL